MNCLTWLCVGTGDIVKKRAAAALANAEGGRLIGICGGRERAQAICDDHDAEEVFDNLDEALAQTKADALYIGTPVYRHGDEALRAIAAGKHVLIEKPLGLTAADAVRMADASDAASVTAGCAYYRRMFPRYAQLKKILAAGTLGRIVLVRLTYCSWFNPSADDTKSWRVKKSCSGGGPLADMGSHMLDILIGLLGLPQTVFAQCTTLVQHYEVEDSSVIVMSYPDGAQAIATFGWNSKAWTHEFEIVGSEGKVKWVPADTGKVVITLGRDVQEIDSNNAQNVHQPLVADFNAAAMETRAPVCPLHEAAKTNVLIDAVYRSSMEGKIVRI